MADPSGGYTRLRVFVGSSSDVTPEREIVRGVLNEVNRTLQVLTPERRVFLEFAGWEAIAYPAAGAPQDVINRQIGPYDIFVGIMWKRFGTPTGVAGSGTEEEFELAYRSWLERQRPQIMFYFSSAPAPPPRTLEEVEQLRKVVEFRLRLEPAALIWNYDGPLNFADVVRPHLMNVVAALTAARRDDPAPLRTQRPSTSGARKRGARAAAAEPAPGANARITGIAPEDAYYPLRHVLIGKTGRLRSLQATGGGWYGGLIELDEPLNEELAVVPLFRFQWDAGRVL